MLRVPAPGRIEDRTVDGSCNPYLAATAMLSAGLDGIERGLDPGNPNTANLYEMSPEDRAAAGIELLPANLLDATRELERATTSCAPAWARPADGDYIDYFIQCKQPSPLSPAGGCRDVDPDRSQRNNSESPGRQAS